jgi:ComEC/Rec2-related protein
MGGWLLASGAGAFWLGILIAGISERGHRQAASVQLLIAGVAWILVGVWLLSSGRRDRPLESGESLPEPGRRQVVALCLALAGFAALGGGWFSFREARTRASPLVAAAGRGVHIDGSLASDPEAHGPGWSASLHASSLQPRTGDLAVEWKVHDLLWIEGRGRPPPSARGDRVALDGIPALPEGDFGGYLRHRGYTATVDVDRFIRAGPPSNPLLRAANGLRSAFRSALADVFPPKEAGLVLGLVLGDTSRLDPGVEDQFRATGLSHLTAVSGENLAMFLAPVLGLAVLLGARRRARMLTGAGAILFFVLLTGGEPSVLRAAAMASIALIGVFLGRPRSAPALMGGALLALLSNDPTLVYSIGFQLSVAATAGMMSMAGPLAARLGFLPEGLSLAVGATLGAQAGVTPLLLYHFGVVPTVTLPANVMAFPAVGPGMLLGLLAAALALLWLPAGGFVAWVARLPLGYLEGLAARLARSPLPSVTSDGLGLAGLFAGLAGVAVLAWWIRSGRGIGRHAAVAIGFLVPAFVWAGAVRAGPPSSLTVTFFDVGQGDAALVRSPDGATILIDGGPTRTSSRRSSRRSACGGWTSWWRPTPTPTTSPGSRPSWPGSRQH